MRSIPIVRDPSALRAALAAPGRGRVALTPTMGALHEGHLSLVRIARERAELVVASVFVNPTQFGPGEDFDRYPRDEAGDVALLAGAGCDLVYAPSIGAIYPDGFSTKILVSGVTEPLEGAFRPGHFAGVATVVAKLLVQAAPDIAIFGEKDFQQLQLIRRLVRDLDLPVEIVGAPILRELDGLALSSRNAYLSPAERRIAPLLHQELQRAAAALAAGEPRAAVEAGAMHRLMAGGFATVDYFEARAAGDLAVLDEGPLSGSARLLTAARLGRTRLIDNLAVTRRPAHAGA